MKSSKPYGFVAGLACMILGIVFALVNYFSLSSNNTYFPKLFMAAGALFTLGLAMLLLPGVVVPADVPNDRKINFWWSRSPVFYRVVWIVAGLIGLVAAFLFMLQVDPDF